MEVFNFHKYDNLRHASHKIDPRRHRYETKGLNIVNLLFAAASGDVTSMRRLHLSGMDMSAMVFLPIYMTIVYIGGRGIVISALNQQFVVEPPTPFKALVTHASCSHTLTYIIAFLFIYSTGLRWPNRRASSSS